MTIMRVVGLFLLAIGLSLEPLKNLLMKLNYLGTI